MYTVRLENVSFPINTIYVAYVTSGERQRSIQISVDDNALATVLSNLNTLVGSTIHGVKVFDSTNTELLWSVDYEFTLDNVNSQLVQDEDGIGLPNVLTHSIILATDWVPLSANNN